MSSNPDSDLPVGACYTIVELLDPDIGQIRMQGNPVKLSAHEDAKTRGPAPELDGNREAILRVLAMK